MSDDRFSSTVSTARDAKSGVVDSLLHPLAIMIRQLLNRSDKKELDRILIDDEENIHQALNAGVSIESLFYSGETTLTEGLRVRLGPETAIHEVAWRTCKKLFEKEKVTRVFAVAKTPAMPGLDAIAEIQGDIIVLEAMSISGNIGAITRTSVALGVGGMVLLNTDPVDVYDRRLIRASRGFVFALPVVTASTEELVAFCKQRTLDILVTSPHAELLVDEIAAYPRRLMIAFGSEKTGCSEALTAAATLQVRIPTNPIVESLNVSAAAGITLYQRRQFNQGGLDKGPTGQSVGGIE